MKDVKENKGISIRNKSYLRNKNSTSGITLIVLVITIIVLLILAGVAIATLTGENGILTQASKAKDKTAEAEAIERVQVEVAGSYGLNGTIEKDQLNKNLGNIDGLTYNGSALSDSNKITNLPATVNLNGYDILIDINGNVIKKITVANGKADGTVFEDNTTIYDEYENQIKIPEGFKIASDSATDVTGGIVIEDATYTNTIGSQFVWIPVGTVYTKTDKSESNTITLGRYDFAKDGTPTDNGDNKFGWYQCQELASSSHGNAVAKDIEAFKISVNNNHGYYIGRYEAGTDAERKLASDSLTQVKVQENKSVYNYVTELQASSLSQNMYVNNKFTSDLINSYAWDTAIVFIQKFSGDIDYSSQTSLQGTITKTGCATDGTNKDVRCNIYDMAGNCREWTTETSMFEEGKPCVIVGGLSGGGSGYITSLRLNASTTGNSRNTSFRIILYL